MRLCEMTHEEIVEKHLCYFLAIFRTGCGCERIIRVDAEEIHERWVLPVQRFNDDVLFDLRPCKIKTREFKLERREGRNLYYREIF